MHIVVVLESCQVGEWARQDAESRLIAATPVVGVEAEATRVLAALRHASGRMSRFFDELVAVAVEALGGDRRRFAAALLQLQPPSDLRSALLRGKTSQGATWHDLTAQCNVEWAVHDGSGDESMHDLCTVQGATWTNTTLTVYSTLVTKLVLAAFVDTLAALVELPDQEEGWAAVCLHYNTAAEAQQATARVWVTKEATQPFKFDFAPTDIEHQYRGRRRRITAVQRESGRAAGRAERVLQCPSR